MAEIKLLPTKTGLDVERALTDEEANRMLHAADQLPILVGRSRDRNRYKDKTPPIKKGSRCYRDRAIIYLFFGSGMRRTGVTKLNLAGFDIGNRTATTEEKGGAMHTYSLSMEAVQAIRTYLDRERHLDVAHWQGSNALFLPSFTVKKKDGEKKFRNSSGRLTVRAINQIWSKVARHAMVEGKTPHGARHTVGRKIVRKTGSVAAVAVQLGHQNPKYSLAYDQPRREELQKALDG